MDLEALQAQFTGRNFGELVLVHTKGSSLETTIAGIGLITMDLPEPAQPLAKSWLQEMNVGADKESFWREDCGCAFARITAAAETKLRTVGVDPTSEDLFNMFQLVLLNLAYNAHAYQGFKPLIQKALGVGFLGRLFG